jgi:hypothetical protein
MIGADGQHVSHARGANRPAQVTPAVDLVSGHEGGTDPALVRAGQQFPASSRCSSSAAHASGRYSFRPIRAWPREVARAKVTATWHNAIPPRVPLY